MARKSRGSNGDIECGDETVKNEVLHSDLQRRHLNLLFYWARNRQESFAFLEFGNEHEDAESDEEHRDRRDEDVVRRDLAGPLQNCGTVLQVGGQAREGGDADNQRDQEEECAVCGVVAFELVEAAVVRAIAGEAKAGEDEDEDRGAEDIVREEFIGEEAVDVVVEELHGRWLWLRLDVLSLFDGGLLVGIYSNETGSVQILYLAWCCARRVSGARESWQAKVK